MTYDEYILALQQAAYERALQLVEERRPVIELVGRELCDNRCARCACCVWWVGGQVAAA